MLIIETDTIRCEKYMMPLGVTFQRYFFAHF